MPEIMRLTYTYDGDTIGAWRDLPGRVEQVHLRLAYIDAPEIAQGPWGIRSRAYLRALLAIGERIQVDIKGTDKYGRLLAEVCRVRDYGNLGLRMVLGGYASLCLCPASQQAYHVAEGIARRKKAGIWSLPGLQQTPWLFR